METKKNEKTIEHYALKAWNSLNAYRNALCAEFSKIDSHDSNYNDIRSYFFELYDYYAGVMEFLDEVPNPFDDNVELSQLDVDDDDLPCATRL